MVISFDIDNLLQIVRLVNQANEKVQEAARIACGVHEHDDWTCQEKTAINSLIVETRKVVAGVQTQFETYALGVKQLADGLDEAHDAALMDMRQVDETFSDALKISTPTAGQGNARLNETICRQMKTVKAENKLENYQLGMFTKPIPICNFGTVALNPEKEG